MMSLLLSTIESPGKKRGLYKFQDPDSVVKAAWVYGQSAHAHQELPVDVGEIPDSRWYPCLVAYNNEDPGYQNVLCKPLLENGCKRPFRTHESRIIYINVDAPQPQPQHFEHSTVTIEEVIEDTVDDAWRNYRWGWWKTCPDWARFVEELHELQD